ncbi:MAG: PHP-associated domain-containing protein [Vicinamibacterales bacterium]
MLKVDLHIHTADDPVDRIPHTTEALLRRAAQLAFDAVAVTLHDRQLELAPLAGLAQDLGITLIPGIERTIHGRHLLLLNFPPHAVGVTTFEEVEALKRRYEHGLVILPHPFFPLGNCMRDWTDRYRHLYDAVEYNGCYTAWLNFNRAAERWARTHGLPLVGGSDTHRLDAFGRTYTRVDAPERSADAICAAIREGHVEVRTEPFSPLGLATYLGRMVLGGQHPQPARLPDIDAEGAAL